jgi:hypothetical protein
MMNVGNEMMAAVSYPLLGEVRKIMWINYIGFSDLVS